MNRIKQLIEQASHTPPDGLSLGTGSERYYHLMYLLVKDMASQRSESERVVAVECGVNKGRGVAAFAMASPKADVYGFDIVHLGEDLCKVLDAYPNITFFQMSSIPARLDKLPPIDVLYLDSAHTYMQVKTEFESYSPGLAPGAVVLIDDLLHWEEDMGVMRAFNEISWPKLRADDLHPGSGYGIVVAPCN